MSAFVDPDEEIEIRIAFGLLKKRRIVAVAKDVKTLTDTYEDLDASTVEEHVVSFRMPSFQDDATIFNGAVTLSGGGQILMNPTTLKIRRVGVLVKSWSFKDKKGKEVPPSIESVASLSPAVASYLASQLEEEIGG